MDYREHILTIREAGDLLGELLTEAGRLLDQAGRRAEDIPPEHWKKVAEAAVQIATAASQLAGDGTEDGD